MKAFNEWWAEDVPCITDGDDYEYYTGAKDGWKAALEWIYCDCCPEDWSVDDIEFDIEMELKDD